MASDVTVASYYFPNYHPSDARNARLKGAGWSEWELVKAARSRFPGHQQPRVPAWGYTDESDPAGMAQKIETAAAHGIDAFIFDWYYYDDGPFLERALEQGFFNAPNRQQLQFGLMWANHDWTDIHPISRSNQAPVLYPGRVTPDTFDRMSDEVIEKYFRHPSYWRIDNAPYFSIYDLGKLLESFGSVAATRAALDGFRAKTMAAGFPELHLNAVVWGQAILPGEQIVLDPGQLVRELGFTSVTSYVWIHHVPLVNFPTTDYQWVAEQYDAYWDQADATFDVPYYPNVTVGWDSSPRTPQDVPFEPLGYPYTAVLSDNTPARFRAALARTKERLANHPRDQRILTINCWNEWTEGSYLEPDTVTGYAYLEAIKEVFGA